MNAILEIVTRFGVVLETYGAVGFTAWPIAPPSSYLTPRSEQDRTRCEALE